jgi:hypothetical protein
MGDAPGFLVLIAGENILRESGVRIFVIWKRHIELRIF